jgi:PAS domain S-box-containing protein
VIARGKIFVMFDDITRRVEAEKALRDSESRYRALVETTATGYVIINKEGRVLDANREYVRLSGHKDLKEILGRTVLEWTAPYEKEKNAAAVARCAADGYIRNFEVDYVDKGGKITPIEVSATVVQTAGVPQILTICRDITTRRNGEAEILALNQDLENRVRERTAELTAANAELVAEIAQRVKAEQAKEKLQEELLQSQKMDAIGRLAGGIAHDFNNILVSISGYAELLMDSMPEGAPVRADLTEILLETQRGASLTRQLMTFSNRQALQLEELDLNELTTGAGKMLNRLIGANIHLTTDLDENCAGSRPIPARSPR